MQITAPAVWFASVHACDRLIVRANLQTLGPIHPSAPVYHTVAGSPVINFSFIQLSSTSWRVISGLNTSGDTHMKYILLVHIIFIKEQFIFALVCNTVYAGQLFITNEALCYGHGARASNVLHWRFVRVLPPGE